MNNIDLITDNLEIVDLKTAPSTPSAYMKIDPSLWPIDAQMLVATPTSYNSVMAEDILFLGSVEKYDIKEKYTQEILVRLRHQDYQSYQFIGFSNIRPVAILDPFYKD